MEKRIKEMVDHWKKEHWAKSNINNDDAEFFKAIKRSSFNTATTSFTGNDIVYYKATKVVPWVGSMIPISRYKKFINNRSKQK